MRSEQDMMNIIVDFAVHDDRIRLVTLEGSRTNKNIPPDRFQDYDISYFVADMDSFKENDQWLTLFGSRVMMQKPEDMELFPSDLGNWFSYLMLFDDGNKLDLTLIPLNEADDYFTNSDGLVEVLLDKDNRVKNDVIADDRHYWIKKPTAREFDDCCNEFWMVSTYVVKGLARKEILFAIDHLNEIARPNLLRMMAWQIGSEHGYTFSVGKNYKFINRYLPNEDWETLLSTYSENGYPEMRRSLLTCYELFRKYSRAVAERLGYTYPKYDEAVTTYTENIFNSLK
ncbi:aminoglycoside 6-adenylyltransferase [Paenibacillus harenae]|uniref:aminoglycoside 6-adenylyltransferase n=1 Tax=Paenibacillus harenae TaxID=306543 RepID=UPI000425CD32|nr:aminoglycoside 6-adenylyltransferase [Paenibacillus harenae]